MFKLRARALQQNVMKPLVVYMASALLLVSGARGELVFGNLGPSGTNPLGGGGSFVTGLQYQAQGFRTPVTGGLLNLTSITLGLNINVPTRG